MPINDQELREYYESFLGEAGDEFATKRIEKKQEIPKLLSEEDVQELEEGDIRELVRSLWAFEIWTNKDYIVNQILEDGIEHVRSIFQQALYETDNTTEKFDLLNNNVNMLGPASVTEILTFIHPQRCAIFNRRAQEALQFLEYSDVPNDIRSGEEYAGFINLVDDLMNRLKRLEAPETSTQEIQDYVDVDYFLYYLSDLDTKKPGEPPERIQDFDHDQMQEKLLEIGDGLGFDVEDEYEAGPGARVDVRWSTRVANLGIISYAFEVHRKGSRDSAILNLQKAQAADPSLQKLVIVSTQDQLKKFASEIDAISTDFAKTISYLEVSKVDQAVGLLTDLKEILQEAGLMGEL